VSPRTCLVIVVCVVLFFLGLGRFLHRYFPTPSNAVEDAYWAANSGDYETAQSFMSSTIRDFTGSTDVRGAWDLITGHRSIQKIHTSHERCSKDFEQMRKGHSASEGTVASVDVDVLKQYGWSYETVYLVKEDGLWKIR
jgi:hypothetical protein